MSDFTPPPLPANPPLSPPADLTEFQYISQFSLNPIGVVIHVGGVPTNVDATMVVAMYAVAPPGTTNVPSGIPSPVLSETASNTATGVYEITFTGNQAGVPGYYRLDWSFTLSSTPQTISQYIEIGQASPAYDSLSPPFQQMVEDVYIKIADGYDSAFGGTNLASWPQVHFGRGRIAQLMIQAVQHLNVMSQPGMVYSANGVSPMGGGAPLFPINQFAGLLNTATTIEVIKHLKRSYTEDPDWQGPSSARLSRRDYQQRWDDNLRDEQADYKAQLDTFKIAYMFNGSPRVLIQGGAFGSYGVPRFVGSIPARPYYMNRFF